VKRYGDLTGGTGVVSGDDTGPRVGDLADMVKAAADGLESVSCLGQYSALFHRKTKPSAIGAGRRRADGWVAHKWFGVIMLQSAIEVVRESAGRAGRSR
jgi:hypothetical protein